ncbi:MAG: hypothetical protein ABSA41_06170 [Terriglobia bacterium]
MLLYKLERRQDERDTRVELPIRLYEYWPENEEGAPTGPCQPMIEVMNCSATSVYIKDVDLEAESENGAKKAVNEKIGCLVKPYFTEKINVYVPMHSAVAPLVISSGSKDQPAHCPPAVVRVALSYKAYGRLSTTEPISFKGEITWGDFHPR